MIFLENSIVLNTNHLKDRLMGSALLVLLLMNTPVIANIDDDIDQDDGSTGSEFPHIPEPMVFDLVRPLGVTQGELEINTLAQYETQGNSVEWAPEIEYAIRDGLAIELELPFYNATLEDYKFAIQDTLPDHSHHFTHGWQMIGRYSRHESSYSADMLYIAGYRFNARWSTLNMLGIRNEDIGKHASLEGLANFTFFYTLNENMALGIETNSAFTRNRWDFSFWPQLHANFTDRLSLQMGAGYRNLQIQTSGIVITSRLIYTF